MARSEKEESSRRQFTSRRQKRSRSNASKRRSPRRRSRRKHRKQNQVQKLTDDELSKLAAEARYREGLEQLYATVRCHGLSRNGVLRAKRRQNYYLSLKSFLLYLQAICLMLVGFMAVITSRTIKEDDQSHYYTSQATIEIILLLVAFSVVLFDHFAIRALMVFLFLSAFFLNVLTITYYILFDEMATGCMRILDAFQVVVCLSTRLPSHHHTVYCALFLALLHFVAFAVAMSINYYYIGTLTHLIELAKALRFRPCETHKETKRRSHKHGKRQKVKRFGTEVDVSKLPVGTMVTSERSTSYKWKGNVQSGGILVGSGVETTTDSVTLQAPSKEGVKRDTKLVRHVTVDAVTGKQKQGCVVAARKRVEPERRALEKKKGKTPSKKPSSSRKSDRFESELDTISFNSLIEMEPTSSPYISEREEKAKKKT
ncbi:hypothetical protein RB195_010080 [Necator americanus]|uniref:Uncharacterized protein n=1 Tax=Necator americanus TaxID=51031 RepID=A0ABR1CYQ6_NECAM